MRKTQIFVIVMIVAILFAVFGCGKKDSTTGNAPDTDGQDADDTDDSTSQAADDGTKDSDTSPDDKQTTTVDADFEDYTSNTGTYSLSKCDHLTVQEIRDAIGVNVGLLQLTDQKPKGCAITYASVEPRVKFFMSIKDYRNSGESAEDFLLTKACVELASVPDAMRGEVGELSCRREVGSIHFERDFFFVKDDYLVQLGTDSGLVSIDMLKALAEIVEPRIKR